MVTQLFIGLVETCPRLHFGALITHMTQEMTSTIGDVQTSYIATDPHVNRRSFLN